jgi:hypothetical protein
MSEQRRDEKDEKHDEKEEKHIEEKWRRDPLSAIAWAAIFIWAGLVLLAENLRLLDGLKLPSALPEFAGQHIGAWALIFFGAGVIVILEALARIVMPEYRRGVMGSFIFGTILIAIGLGSIWGWGVIWPLVLIIIGVAIMLGGFFRSR